MRKIGVITVVVDGVRQNIKKGMVKNDQIKSQKKRNHKDSKAVSYTHLTLPTIA